MDTHTIIRKPIITEKATFDSSESNRITFEIDRRATKAQVKQAIEKIYGVRVLAVSTQRRKGETSRGRHGGGSVRRPRRAACDSPRELGRHCPGRGSWGASRAAAARAAPRAPRRAHKTAATR